MTAASQALALVDQLFAKSSADGVFAFDRELRVSFWSQSLEQLFDVSCTAAVGRDALEAMPFLGAGCMRAALAGESSSLRDASYMVPGRGRVGRFEADIAPLRDGTTIVGGVALIRDTTARREAAQTLFETEQRFQNMADVAPVLLWMAGPDSMCTFFNQTWLDFTGRALDQEWGVGWAESVHFEDLQRCLDVYVDAFNAREAFELEYRLRRADGEFRWVLDRGTPRYTADGTFAGFIGSCVDITELRQVIGVKDAFLGMVSHELRTPLTTLSLVLERLRIEDGELSKQHQASLGRMDRALARMSQLVESLLQFSRIERGGLQVHRLELDLSSQIDLVIDELRPSAADKGLELSVAMSRPLPAIWSDPELIRLIVSNLVTNAIKFTERGSIQIVLSFGAAGHRIEVVDTGPGIPAELQARVFEPFEQLEPSRKKHTPGVGLGLALVQAMTSALGGRVELHSETGRGSTFALQFPARGTDADVDSDRRG